MICCCVLQGTAGNDGPPGPPGERVSPKHTESGIGMMHFCTQRIMSLDQMVRIVFALKMVLMSFSVIHLYHYPAIKEED